VKESCRQDQRNFYDAISDEAEETSLRYDMKTMYKNINRMSGISNTGQDGPLRSKDGTYISNEKNKIDRWKEYFNNLLNRLQPSKTQEIAPSDKELTINTGPKSINEVQEAIRKLKNGKALGDDRISA
jgi:hypothetical protein